METFEDRALPNSDTHLWFAAAIAGLVVGAGASGMLTAGVYRARLDTLQLEAVERGYGIYCPFTSQFAWAGDCPPRPVARPPEAASEEE